MTTTRRLTLVLLVLLGALAARILNLDESLWNDEIVYTRLMLEGKSLDWVFFHDVHPPLYALILLGWINLFGDGTITVRLPSLLFGLASLATLFALARHWFGRGVAILAMSLMALSPPHIWYSQENKTNMLVILMSLAVIWRLDLAWNTNRVRDWILFSVVAVLALWSHAFNLFVILTSFSWLAIQIVRKGGRTRIKGVMASIIAIAICILPLVYAFFREGEGLQRDYLRSFTLPEVYKFVLIYLSHGNTLRTLSPYAELGSMLYQPLYLFLIDGFFAALVLLGFWAAITRWRQSGNSAWRLRSELLVAYFTVPLIGLLLGSLIYPKIFVERSMLILLPPFVILVSSGIMSIHRSLLRRLILAAVLIVNGVALFNFWVCKADEWTVYKQNPDWRGAVQHMARERYKVAGFGVPVLLTCPGGALIYYLRGLEDKEEPDLAARKPPPLMVLQTKLRDRELIHRAFQRDGIRTFFFIVNRYWDEDEGKLLAALRRDSRYRFTAKTEFKGLDVFEIHREDPGQPNPARR